METKTKDMELNRTLDIVLNRINTTLDTELTRINTTLEEINRSLLLSKKTKKRLKRYTKMIKKMRFVRKYALTDLAFHGRNLLTISHYNGVDSALAMIEGRDGNPIDVNQAIETNTGQDH